MGKEAEEVAELAIIDLLFARAELLTLEDPQALIRAVELLNKAIAELEPLAPRFGAKGSIQGLPPT